MIDKLQGGNKKALAAAHMTRGYWMHRKGDLKASMADYNKGLDYDPNSFEGYDYRADLWVAMGNDERARSREHSRSRFVHVGRIGAAQR